METRKPINPVYARVLFQATDFLVRTYLRPLAVEAVNRGEQVKALLVPESLWSALLDLLDCARVNWPLWDDPMAHLYPLEPLACARDVFRSGIRTTPPTGGDSFQDAVAVGMTTGGDDAS